ncbi:unnamed protein product [Mesocestoides corti]|uniref:SH3 domain-containing protein n=1 Tax=Mesocestoides corti TaxID=53468 RepID=A0A0R3U6V3_MESCO|nr:unnamed protein product [Mesocestoides corti]
MPDADTLSDMPSVRSNTPSSGIRPKSYVKYPSLDGSRMHGSPSPVGYKTRSSICSDQHQLHDQRPSSASHLARYVINHNNYSQSANSSLCYGHNGHSNEPKNRRPSPTIIQTQYRTSANAEKYARKVLSKPTQQKYLVHHSLNKPGSPNTVTTAKSDGSVAHSIYFPRKNSSKYFVAIFDYQAHCDEDLTVHKGDVVIMLDHSDADWWLVENATTNLHGYVPSAYLAEENSIHVFEWFFREMSRKDSERLLLLHGNPLGTFLVRASETTQGNHHPHH